MSHAQHASPPAPTSAENRRNSLPASRMSPTLLAIRSRAAKKRRSTVRRRSSDMAPAQGGGMGGVSKAATAAAAAAAAAAAGQTQQGLTRPHGPAMRPDRFAKSGWTHEKPWNAHLKPCLVSARCTALCCARPLSDRCSSAVQCPDQWLRRHGRPRAALCP